MKKENKKVLIVVTSHELLGNTGERTGYYLPEVAHPYRALSSQGFEVDIASPKGGNAPLDPNSLDNEDVISREFYAATTTRAKLENTLALAEIDPEQYQAVVYAGGHGTMWDFRNNGDIARVNREIYEKGGVVAAVCHGPAALLSTSLSNGKALVAGKNVAAFSDAEEEAAGLTAVMPFLLETELKNLDAKYSKAGLWQKHVVVDERLVTGQNPASAEAVGVAVVNLLKK